MKLNNNLVKLNSLNLRGLNFKYFLSSLMVLAIFGCEKDFSKNDPRPFVLASTGIIEDAVKNIVGDLARVEALMGPGVDPHLYKPRPSDLSRLRSADIIFFNGLNLEGKMGQAFLNLSKLKPVYAVSDTIPIDMLRKMDKGKEVFDPHIWFDVKIWADCVAFIAEKLAAHDTANATAYRKNARTYISELTELDEWVREVIGALPAEKRVMVTAHDAFGYFGRTYQLEVYGLQGISTIAEFGLRDVSNLVGLIIDKNIPAVFVESAVSTRSLEAVISGANQKGHNVIIGGKLYTDALGGPGSPEGNYVGMVKKNVMTIVGALD